MTRSAIVAVLVGLVILVGPDAPARPTPKESANMKRLIYKTVGKVNLRMTAHFPQDWKASDKRPAIVFFFGGGWVGGSIQQFRRHADYLATRGMVTFRADYRVKSRHGVTPDKCVEDGKSAVRYLRANAAELGIDPDRIVASGGSAGGHVAACTALTKGLEAPGEDHKIASRPNAMVLFNPVAKVFGNARLAGAMKHDPELGKAISPVLHVKKTSPPMIVFYGTDDPFYKIGGKDFQAAAATAKARATFCIYKGQQHGFFNRPPWYQTTVRATDEFLGKLGYVQGPPTITLPARAKRSRD